MTAISKDAIRSHIEQRFAAVPLELAPFPHLILEDFFPEAVYEQILAYNPFKYSGGKEWISKRMVRLRRLNATPYELRKQIELDREEAPTGPDEAVAFWRTIEQVFTDDDWFLKLVYAKFPVFFQLRFGDVQHEELWPLLRTELFLQRHDPGYSIGPHTDISTRIFTCIFSFADRPGFDEYGTLLMRHRDRMARCWGDTHHAFEDFETVKVAPYRPNNFLLFFKTRQSFHAVPHITEDVPNQRYGMQFQLYEPPGGIFTDLSRPRLMLVGEEKLLGRPLGKWGRRISRILG